MGARRMLAVPAGGETGKARLKFGVLSDIHVRDVATQQVFIKALEWFRDHGVDGVLVAGDMADHGRVSQLKLVADAWFQVFPDGKAPDGRRVEQMFEYGNHDVSSYGDKQIEDKSKLRDEMIRFDPAGNWERCFHEKYAPLLVKEVKGYRFIGAHWPAIGALNGWMDKNGKGLDPSLPFFYFQHSHPKDTCYGPWAWGHDNGASTKALSPFGNAIAFSGHSHYTLTDERSVWQGAFTSIGTSSLSYSSTDYSFRENMPGNGSGTRENRRHQMPNLATGNGKQGMLLSVCDDHIRIERHEFVYDQSLGDDWVLPVGKAAEKPFAYAKRKRARVAPEFPAGAKVVARVIEPAKPKDPQAKPAAPTQVEVKFPFAATKEGCRVFEYEVRAVVVADDVELVCAARRVMARDFHLPPAKAGLDGTCVFAISELPAKTPLRFEVSPLECFGLNGASIATESLLRV